MVMGPEQEVYFVILLLFYVPLKNISLILWRHNDQSRMAANYKPILGTVRTTFDQEWVSVATPTTEGISRGLGFWGVIRRDVPVYFLWTTSKGYLWPILASPLPQLPSPSSPPLAPVRMGPLLFLLIYCSQSPGSETHQCFAFNPIVSKTNFSLSDKQITDDSILPSEKYRHSIKSLHIWFFVLVVI